MTDEVYRGGVQRAVRDSIEELRISYETATQRGEDYFKHLIWALAHSDIVDVRVDDWLATYGGLAGQLNWNRIDEKKLRTAIGNFKTPQYGNIITNTPARYGSAEKRYRFKRFTNMLMRGHVRLQAESEGVNLGKEPGL